VGLQNIPKEKRRTEEELLREFEASKAEILGGFLDTLVKAIQIYPSVNPKGLFRMADFTRWGCAIAIALGKTEKDFLDAYENKVKVQIEEAAHTSPVATVLLDFMEKRGENWTGTPTELFIALLNHAKILDISTRQQGWPKAPHVLVRQLNELAPSLKSLGYEIITSKSGGTRRTEINTVPSAPLHENSHKTGATWGTSCIKVAAPETTGKTLTNDARDAGDAILPNSSNPVVSLNDLKSVYLAQFYDEHKCAICGSKKLTSWKAELFKGSDVVICEDCKKEWEKKREGAG
jgi:hypothetical protein